MIETHFLKPLSSKSIVVIGATGQVGRALLNLLKEKAIGLDRQQADLQNPGVLLPLLDRLKPKIIINAGAYTAVDQAESNEPQARIINGEAPGTLANWCKKNDAYFVHYSTDYVFSGEGDKPWLEEDSPSPINAYGRSKLEGEKQIIGAGGRFLIFRTSWVYDAKGKNFVRTMLNLGQQRESLKIVADQHGAPTYAPHLALATVQALEKAFEMDSFPSGVYHLCNEGVTTWYDFAIKIFEEARMRQWPLKIKQIEAISSSSYPVPAQRPKNSRLCSTKAKQILGVYLPDWKLGLRECMENVQ